MIYVPRLNHYHYLPGFPPDHLITAENVYLSTQLSRKTVTCTKCANNNFF